MNPTTRHEAEPQTSGQLSRYAWLPIPLLLAAIIAARMAGLTDTYQSHALLLVLSFTFYTLVSLGTLYLVGRSFLALGSPSLLLLECGVIFWSLAGTVGDLVYHGDMNINVTIFNTGILLAGLCHLSGAILGLRPQRALRPRPLWLGAGCAFVLGTLWLVAQAALSGWLPVFFIPGHGGTLVRYYVLISAIVMFVLSASVLHSNQRRARLPFTSWYTLALLLLAVGLFGVMIQLSMGSIVNWLSRTAQWLGGIYLLFASVASMRQSQLPLLPPGTESHPAFYRDAVAVAMVLAAAAIRLTFLSVLGMQTPFVTFYPAVMFAALYGGWRAGLLATVLSAILADYFWLAPASQGAAGQSAEWLALSIFLMSGTMIAGISDAMHRAHARATAAETQALLATEREAAAKALEENEARLRLAQETANVGIWDWQVETGLLDFTPELNKLYGLPPGTIRTYGDWRDRVHPDDIDRIEAGRKKAIAKHEPFDLEFRGLHTSGEYRWISTKGGAIYNEAGEAIRVFGVNIDITERKRAEEALRAREADLNEAQRLAHIGSWHWDAKTDVTTGSDELLRIFGFDPATQTMPDFREQRGRCYPAEEWERVNAAVQKTMETGIGYQLDVRAIKNGMTAWVTTRGEAVRDADGRIMALRGTVQDITERKQAEEALRQAAVEQEAIFESVPLLISLHGRDGAWLKVNPAVVKLFGLDPVSASREEIASRLRARFPDGTPLNEKNMPSSRALRGETVRNAEYVITDSEGKDHVLLINAVPLQKDGNMYGMVLSQMDITERKRAEEAVKQNQKTFAELIERAPFGIYVVDSRFRIAQMNTGSQNNAFRNVRPVIGRDFNDAMRVLWPEPVAVEIIGHFRHTLETGEPYYSRDFIQPRSDVEIEEAYEWELHRIMLPDGHYGVICYYFDSTGLRQAEKALRESEERKRMVLEASEIGTFEVDLQTGAGLWNNVEYELLGLKPGETPANPETFFQYVHPDDVGMVRMIWEKALQDGEFDAEFRIVRADNQERWLAGKGRFLYESGGDNRPLRFLGVNFDITARKQVEEALLLKNSQLETATNQAEDKRLRLAAMMEALPIGVAITDARGGSVQSNEAFERIWAGPRPETESIQDYVEYKAWWADTGKPVEPEEWASALAVRTGGAVTGQLMRIQRFDGSEAFVINSASPIRDAEGAIAGCAVAIQDITELKRAEEAVRESEERYRAVVENTTAIVLRIDPNGVINFANNRALEFFGYTADELIGRHAVGAIVPPQETTGRDLEALVRQIGAAPDSFHSNANENICKDGRRVWVEWTNSGVYGADGRMKEFLSVGIDATERKRAEEALQKAHMDLADQMEERVRELAEKEVLLKEIHHRVKNNLQVISSLVSMQADGIRNEAVREVLRDVIYRVRAMALVHEKLYQSDDLARINFAEYAKGLLNYLWRAHGAVAETIRLTLDLDSAPLPVDTAVPCGLILNELAGNALKHAFRGRSDGEVTVSLRASGSGRISFSVRDNGVGLPEGLDWRQANSLGLRLVQMLARQLQADVAVISGEGTKFEIIFQGRIPEYLQNNEISDKVTQGTTTHG